MCTSGCFYHKGLVVGGFCTVACLSALPWAKVHSSFHIQLILGHIWFLQPVCMDNYQDTSGPKAGGKGGWGGGNFRFAGHVLVHSQVS